MLSPAPKRKPTTKKKSDNRLRDGEKEKFCRKGHTDKGSNTTLTGDEIIGEILNTNSALLPITVTEFGQFGSLFERFLFGREAIKIPNFSDNQQNTKEAAKLAHSTKVPHSVLPRANEIWRKEHEGFFWPLIQSNVPAYLRGTATRTDHNYSHCKSHLTSSQGSQIKTTKRRRKHQIWPSFVR